MLKKEVLFISIAVLKVGMIYDLDDAVSFLSITICFNNAAKKINMLITFKINNIDLAHHAEILNRKQRQATTA